MAQRPSRSTRLQRRTVRIAVSVPPLRQRSIRQSVQNGQFIRSFAEDPPYLVVAAQPHQRIERCFVHEVVTAPSIDQAPTLQPLDPTHDDSARHAHVASYLCNGKRAAIELTKRDAESDEKCFQPAAERLGL